MNPRRAAVLLLVVPVLAGCGGGDDDAPDGKPDADATSSAATGGDSGDGADVCALVGLDEVARAVGTEVEEGIATEGPVAAGGTQSTCTWKGVESPASTATVTVYSEASAADSVRTDDSAPLPEVGDDAFVGPFASVWAYGGGGSFTAQWYDFEGSDEENLPKSTTLALLVRDAL